MKKTRIALIITVIIALVCILTACNVKEASFKEVFDEPVDNELIYQASRINLYSPVDNYFTLIGVKGIFAVFRGDPINYYFYNMKSDSIFKTYTIFTEGESFYDFTAIEVGNGNYIFGYYIQLSSGVMQSTFVTQDGTFIQEYYTYVTPVFNETTQILTLDNDLFYIDEAGTVLSSNDQIMMENNVASAYIKAGKPSINASSEDYYYYISDNQLYIYSDSFELIGSHTIPSYAESIADDYYFILENGDILAQYLIPEPSDATEYDIFTNGEKMTVITKLINAKTGKAKEIDFEYLLFNVMTATDFEDYLGYSLKKSIKNIAVGFHIENQRISSDAQSMKFLSLSNTGKVKMTLNDTFPAQGATLPEYLGGGYYRLDLDNGTTILVDKKGIIKGNINDTTSFSSFAYVSNDKIIAFDGKELLDLSLQVGNTLRYEIALTFSNCYVIRDNVTATYFALNSNGDSVPVGDLAGSSAHFFYTKAYNQSVVATYTFYNAKGESILTINGDYSSVGNFYYSDDRTCVIIKATTTNGNNEYYRFVA